MENSENKSKIKFSERVLSKKQIYILLAVIIILQVLNITYYFAVRKQGYHSDEIWSYGFANSFYEPYIYNNEDDSPAMGVWRDGSDFDHYITVQKGQQFRVDSVWYNEVPDMHPPLYPAILHIICSFFPDTFSKYFGYLINFVSMIIGQIYLYRVATRLCKSDFLGILVCLLWGFCTGYINLNVYLRAYSLITMLSIMLLFYHTRLYLSEGSFKGNLIKIGVIIIIGALSHHYFLILSFAIVACFCFFYLFKKQWKKMFAYALSMAGSVLVSIVLFPATIDHLLTRGTADTQRLENAMPYIHGLRYNFSLITDSLAGYRISAYATSWYAYVVAALVLLIAVGAPLCFLFRKEEWFKKFSRKVIDALKYFGKNFDFMLLFMIITIFFVLSIIAITVNLNTMSVSADRYLFYVMPWTAIAAVLIVKYLFRLIKPLYKYHKYVISALCCLALVSSLLFCETKYFFEFYPRGRGGIDTTVTKDSKYIMLIEDNWILTVYPYKLLGCKSFLAAMVVNYQLYIEEMQKITPDENTYLILDTTMLDAYSKIFGDEKDEDGNVVKNNITYKYEDDSFLDNVITEDDVIEKFENEIYPGYKLQFYGSEIIFGRIDHIFRIVPEEDYIDVPINDIYMENKEKAKKLEEEQKAKEAEKASASAK
ncbi:MAG: hypothetical protein ACI4J0_11450 [Huintestinicola sp.]|uniref:hypothetical protein n=1 Tax=Huintestinicola sp. TaxID=2981661 RepID=UPI003F061853